MKKSLVMLLLIASGAAFAQTTSSDAGSTANSGSASTINSNAVGNTASSGSNSASNSGATSGSQSGALGNVVNIDQRGPTSQTITGTSTNTNNTTVNGTSTENVKYSGTIEQRASGGYTNTTTENVNQNVHYSGTQTIKNVPGIAMSGPASGPCTGASGGLGIAGPGFGVGLNGAKVDDGCTVRENTRVLGQLFQSLDSANPAKAEAQAALLEGMAIIRNMNKQIGAGYAPQPAPKTAEAAPAAPAPTVKAEVTPSPVMMPVAQTVAANDATITDPYIRARMGLAPLKK